MTIGKLLAGRIWKKYERHLGNPAHANQDEESFILNVGNIIDAEILNRPSLIPAGAMGGLVSHDPAPNAARGAPMMTDIKWPLK